jgi:RNA polymerase sigma-70 factor (ECF subfamily)
MDTLREAEHRALFERAAAGDSEAVGRLLEHHMPGLRAWVRLRASPVVRAREETEDLVQSVCRELLESLDRIDYAGAGAFRHWLYTAALRKIVEKHERYRAQKRDVLREVRMPAGTSGAAVQERLLTAYRSFSSPSQKLLLREQIEQIERAFGELGDEEREVILLARVAGLSRREMAQQLGKSEVAVRQTLHRALARLATKIGADAN